MKKIFRAFTVLCMAALCILSSACGGGSTEGGAQPTQVTGDGEDNTQPTQAAEGDGKDLQPTPTAGDEEEDAQPTQAGQDSENAQGDGKDSDPSETQTVVLDETTVKLLGRTQKLLDKNLLCAHSGSGVEFDFTGRHLEVELVGDSSAREDNEENCARVAVYIDDVRVQDMMLTKRLNKVTLLDGEEPVSARVRIVKLSETAQSVFAIRPIKLKGDESIVPTPDKAHTIEFVGDSITCGYGVDDEVASHHFSTKTEDATKAYAYKTAQLLGADYSLVSISGYGIISGYTDNADKKSGEQVMGKYYDKLGNSYAGFNNSIFPQQIGWDFTRFVPEVIVINLGTNDASYCGRDEAKRQEYVDGYIAFLEQVRQNNPDAMIVCTLGLMGQDLCEAMDRAVAAYTEKSGDAKVHSFWLEVQDTSLGIAADWHPTEANHERAAAKLAEKIRELMGWEEAGE